MAVILDIISVFDEKGVKAAVTGSKKVETGWGKVGAGFKKAAIPAAAGFATITAFAATSLQAARDQAGSYRDLNAVLTSMGYPQLTKQVSDYAESVSKATGMDDEAIRAAQLKLVSMKNLAGNAELVGRATALAADLTAAGFGDLTGTATILGKALEDPEKGMTKLQRAGIKLSDQQIEQIKKMEKAGDTAGAQEVIMKELEKRYGKVGEASKSSADDIAVGWEDAQEQLGTKLMPVWGKFQKLLIAGIDFISKHTTLVFALGAAFAALTGFILLVNGAMAAYAAISTVVTGVMKLWKSETIRTTISQWALNAALLANPVGLIIIAVVALVAALVILWMKCEGFRNVVKKVFNTALNVIKGVWNWVKRNWPLLLAILAGPIGIAVLLIVKNFDKIKAAFQFVIGVVKNLWNGFMDLLRGAVSILSSLWTRMTQPFVDAFRRAIDVVKGLWDGLWDKISAIVDKIKAVGNSVKGIVDKINPFSNSSATFVPIAVGPTTMAATPSAQRAQREARVVMTDEQLARALTRILLRSDARNGRTVFAP